MVRAPPGSDRPGQVRVYTTNPGKVREIRALLEPRGIRVAWSRRRLVEIQGDSLEEVARSKLNSVSPRPGELSLVEDSGLFIHSLGGFPGVYSAYAYRTLGLAGVLRLVRGRDRSATFRCVVGVRQGPEVLLARGAVTGSLARTARGTLGFGFDPIFIPRGCSESFAEMPADVKNRYSHRGRAFRALLRALPAAFP